jgi:hypothetical protein
MLTLIRGDEAPVPTRTGELGRGGNRVVTDPTGTERTQTESLAPESAFKRRIPDWTGLSRTRGAGS